MCDRAYSKIKKIGNVMDNKLLKIEEYSKPEAFNITNKGIEELGKKYKGLTATNNKEFTVLKAGIKDIRDRRIAVKNRKDEIKRPIIDAGNAVDAEAKRIINALVKIENPLKKEKEKYEAEQERIKEEKAAKEKLRVDTIQAKIKALYDFSANLHGKTSKEITETFEFFKDCKENDQFDYEEFTEVQEKAVESVEEALNKAFDIVVEEEERKAKIEEERIANEKEKKRLEDEKAKLDKQKKELEEAKRIQDEALVAKQNEIAKETTISDNDFIESPKLISKPTKIKFIDTSTPFHNDATPQIISNNELTSSTLFMPKTIEITHEEYEELRIAKLKLQLLENGGVDNWTFYDEALKNFDIELKELLQELNQKLS